MGYSPTVIEQTLPLITYTTNVVEGSWSAIQSREGQAPLITTYNHSFEYRRHCTQIIKVVACNYSQALSKVNQYISKYLYNTYDYKWSAEAGNFVKQTRGKKLMCNISSNHNGHLWEVQLQVNEDDTAYSLTKTSPESIFATLNTERGY